MTQNKSITQVINLHQFNEIVENYRIQDFEEKIVHPNFRKKIYFDSFDVIRMLQGVRAFERQTKFDKYLFESDYNLVHALAYNNFLNQIHLLPPHLNELIDKISDPDSYLFPKKDLGKKDPLTEEFLIEIQFDDIKEKLKKVDPNNFDQFMDIIGKDPYDLFKINYFLSNYNWHKRFIYLYQDNKILQLKTKSKNLYRGLDDDSLFKKIKSTLDQFRRHGWMKSNFSDALALTILQKELEVSIKSNYKEPVPIFYLEKNSLLYRIIQILRRKNKELFSYNIEGQTIEIIRDSSFFILDIIFNHNKEKDESKHIKKFFRNKEEISLEELKEHIKSKLDGGSIDKNPNKRYLSEKEKSILGNVKQLLNRGFIREIWLNQTVYQDLKKNIEDFEQDFDFDTKQEVKKINKEIEDTLVQLDFDAETLKIYSRIWNKLDTRKLKSKLSNFHFPHEEFDVFNDFGLLRFSFDSIKCAEIQTVSQQLFDHSLQAPSKYPEFANCIWQIINNLMQGIEDPTNEKNIGNLLTGLGILWIFEHYRLIDEICTKVKKINNNSYPKCQIALVHAGALSKMQRVKSVEVDNILGWLDKARFLNGKSNNYKISIGIAYILFRRWTDMTDWITVPELEENSYVLTQEKNRTLFKRVLKYLEDALEFLEAEFNNPTIPVSEEGLVERKKKYYYALNNIIYYTTKGGTEKEFLAINERVNQLRAQYQKKDQSQLWQTRFYDTLGWYYLRLAILNDSDPKQFEDNIILAREFNGRALRNTITQDDKDQNIILRGLIVDVDHGNYKKKQ